MTRVLFIGFLPVVLLAGLSLAETTYYRPTDDTTGCVAAPVSCRVHMEQPLLDRLADAGFTAKGFTRTVRFKALRCGTDIRLPRRISPAGAAPFFVFREDQCQLLAADCSVAGSCDVDVAGTPQLRGQQEPCACRGASGICRVPLADGGIAPAPAGVTLDPGAWTGAGCVRKSCDEVQGEQGSSWPDECPP